MRAASVINGLSPEMVGLDPLSEVTNELIDDLRKRHEERQAVDRQEHDQQDDEPFRRSGGGGDDGDADAIDQDRRGDRTA